MMTPERIKQIEERPRKKAEPEYWGRCLCGHLFREPGYSLAAHEKECWGRDGKTPHPRNKAHDRPSKAESGKRVMAERLARKALLDSDGSMPKPAPNIVAAENGGVA